MSQKLDPNAGPSLETLSSTSFDSKKIAASAAEQVVVERCLRDFEEEMVAKLKADTSPLGQMVYHHLIRQVEAVDRGSKELEATGLNPQSIKAAILASDLTKFGSLKDTVELVGDAFTSGRMAVFNPHTTPEQLEKAKSVSPGDSFLVNLFYHSAAGAEKAFKDIAGKLVNSGIEKERAEELAVEVLKDQVGHDSFARSRGGIGTRFLLDKMKAVLGGNEIGYPTPVTANGFVTEILDRVEATTVPTIVRYITEVAINHSDMPKTSSTGTELTRGDKAALVPNYSFAPAVLAKMVNADTWGNLRQLQSIYGDIKREINERLTSLTTDETGFSRIYTHGPEAEEAMRLQAVLNSPQMREFEKGLKVMESMFKIAGIKEFPRGEGPAEGYLSETGDPITTVAGVEALLKSAYEKASLQ